MREDVRAVAPKNDTAGNWQELVSSATRLDAAEKNMTALPSPLMEGSVLASLGLRPGAVDADPLGCAGQPVADEHVRAGARGAVHVGTLQPGISCPGTRLAAWAWKTTRQPSALIAWPP